MVAYATDDDETYDVVFYDDTILTTVTADPDTVSDWISDIMQIHRYRLNRLIVGLDVEWRPCYIPGRRNPVATVQICVGRRCLIYQIIYTDYFPQYLIDFLSDENFTFVGVDVQSDLDKLDNDYGIGGNAHAVDLRMLAADAYDRQDLNRAGLKTLANFVLGKEMEKPEGVRRSNWARRWLTDEQVDYACVDAFVSFEIGRVLKAYNY
ncbi:hypothetical protein CASFOL_019392 [Castilleja foliolosa]|uniref:3'-5' exonuclease domain-containing protein n=1 Tax=Castilleja foliolosa TaxID=1961234 RepID=A0ABD3D480_9LAMI